MSCKKERIIYILLVSYMLGRNLYPLCVQDTGQGNLGNPFILTDTLTYTVAMILAVFSLLLYIVCLCLFILREILAVNVKMLLLVLAYCINCSSHESH